jgi:hypothetical protein
MLKWFTYLPIFGNYSKSYITIAPVYLTLRVFQTIKKLALQSTSVKKFESLEDEIKFICKKKKLLPPTRAPGILWRCGFKYCRQGAGNYYKKKFEVLMKQQIFVPLNMRVVHLVAKVPSGNPSGGRQITTATQII